MEMRKAFMLRAIDLARAGMERGDGGPFGAVVVKGGEIVGEGWNQVLSNLDPTAHGELGAIRNACKKLGTFSLEGCEMYTTGEPCPMCMGAILWARVERVYHGFRVEDAARVGFDDREFFQQLALPPELRSVPSLDCGRDEALALLAEYEGLPDRQAY